MSWLPVCLTAAGWAALFEEAFSQETLAEHPKLPLLKTFGIRLSLSKPQLTLDNAAWLGLTLRNRSDTNAWTGAYLFFRSPWNTEKFHYFFDQVKVTGPTSHLEHGKVQILKKTPPKMPTPKAISVDSPVPTASHLEMEIETGHSSNMPTTVETLVENVSAKPPDLSNKRI